MSVSAAIVQRLVAAGLDVVAPLRIGWYHGRVGAELRLADDDSRPCVLIGNSRALWAPFLAWAQRREHRALAAPVDAYAMEQVRAAFGADADRCRFFWAHETAPGRLVGMQKMAAAAGIAALDASAHLALHREFGAWFALRAAVVVDDDGAGIVEGLPAAAPAEPEGLASPAETEAARVAMKEALAAPREWQRWVAMRDVFAHGRAHRYGDQQMRYHYVKDKEILWEPQFNEQ